MSNLRPAQIKPYHLARRAVVYLRQSTLRQVEENTGSTLHQRNQEAFAHEWGWADNDIEVIDQDLGLSGTSGEHRPGWQRLLKLVSDGQVGIIFVSDVSRLSRSRRDFYTLVEVCRLFGVLLAVNGGIVQFDNPRDEFMMNISADFAQYDNAVRRDRFVEARRAKANEGYAVSRCPTGYVVVEKLVEKDRVIKEWVQDPDSGVRERIQLVLDQFEVLGTVGKVLRFLVDHHLDLPVHGSFSDLHWVRPNRVRIYRMLQNPAYAGIYIFGKEPRPHDGGAPHQDGPGRITKPGLHPGYITPATWERNQERLQGNCLRVGQPAGPGPALCQGMFRCGRCGRHMAVGYYRVAHGRNYRYTCERGRNQYGEPRCWGVNGRRVDETVEAELLRAFTPPELEAVVEAAGEANAGHDAIQRQREADLARVRYEADLAEARYKNVDPRHRQVAASLEEDWERAKDKIRDVERQQADAPCAPPLQVTPEALQAIRQLAIDVPGLWRAPSTTAQDRKLLARLLIQEVRLVALSKTAYDIEIAWVGGATTRHRVAQFFAASILVPRLAAEGLDADEIVAELARQNIRKHDGQAYTCAYVSIVLREAARKRGKPPQWQIQREVLRAPLLELTAAGWNAADIADELNRRGYRARENRLWTKMKVGGLRQRLHIPAGPRPRPRRSRPLPQEREDICGPLRDLVAQGWTNPAIADEFTRRGARDYYGRVSWNSSKIKQLRHRLGLTRPTGLQAGRRAWLESIQELLRALVTQGWTDRLIADEFTRRGLQNYCGQVRWDKLAIRLVRKSIGLDGSHWPRLRDPRSAAHLETLRGPLQEFVSQGWSDPQIAAAFTQRGLLRLGGGTAWHTSNVARLRYVLGIPAVLPPGQHSSVVSSST